MDLFSDIRKKPAPAITVTALIRRIKRCIEAETGRLWIEGEVSNLKKQASGHWYFSLKDENAQISCAIFNAKNREGSEHIESGTLIRVFAEATVYPARGQLQLIVEKAEISGQGDLHARFEALKKKLSAEGLFAPQLKKPLPDFPQKIGLITSPTGAALQDILNILHRRAPWAQPILIPVRVQGTSAAKEMVRALAHFHGLEALRPDLIIIGRGGGSLEDLWPFNEEILARAIAACPIPIISAVGHEIDYTIADFTADLRAPTPSAAAELAVPEASELLSTTRALRKRAHRALSSSLRVPSQQLDAARESLQFHVLNSLEKNQRDLSALRKRHAALHPLRALQRRREHISQLHKHLSNAATAQLANYQQSTTRLQSLLRTLGPVSAYKRGFSITVDHRGRAVRSVKEIKAGQEIRTKLLDGTIHSVTSASKPSSPSKS